MQLDRQRLPIDGRLSELDAVRGLAACVVAFGYHTQFLFDPGILPDGWGGPAVAALHRYGWMGVDLFFVLSGFVFAHVYLAKGLLVTPAQLADFAVARFARLYPLHCLTLLVMMLLFWFKDNNGPLVFLAHLALLQTLVPPVGYSFNGPSWSISVEILCYLLFAVGAWAGQKVLCLIAAIAMVVGAVIVLYDGPSGQDLSTADTIARGMLGFFVGVTLCHFRATAMRLPFLVLALVALAGLAIEMRGSNPVLPVTLLTWPSCIIMALRTPRLATPPLMWVGDRSYSIYLWHMPLADFLSYSTIGFTAFALDPLIIHVAFVLAVLSLADYSFRRIEIPAQSWIRHRWAARAKRKIDRLSA